MQYSHTHKLNLCPGCNCNENNNNARRLAKFTQIIIDTDAELGIYRDLGWLRHNLFLLFNLALGIDIEHFCNDGSRSTDREEKEKEEAATEQ
jgi:hypothetical protein